MPAGLLISGEPLKVSGGGQPLLWQHLFWFFAHPAVYIMILPAMGIVSDILLDFSRKPIFGYGPWSTPDRRIAGLGFIVWGHHMFQSGMNPMLGTTFMVSTMIIAAALGHQDLQLAGNSLGRIDPLHRADASCHRLHLHVRHRRAERNLHGFHAGGHIHSRHLLHRRRTSTMCFSGGAFFGDLRRDFVLVSEDVRPRAQRFAWDGCISG